MTFWWIGIAITVWRYTVLTATIYKRTNVHTNMWWESTPKLSRFESTRECTLQCISCMKCITISIIARGQIRSVMFRQHVNFLLRRKWNCGLTPISTPGQPRPGLNYIRRCRWWKTVEARRPTVSFIKSPVMTKYNIMKPDLMNCRSNVRDSW